MVVRQFALANEPILAGDYPALDTMTTENDSQIRREAEERNLQRMANVHDYVVMWQGNQHLCATQKESHAWNTQMTVLGWISDTEEIIKASWSLSQHDGAATFILSERSALPPALSGKSIPGGRTQIQYVRRIRRIKRHSMESDEESAPARMSDAANWLNWNIDLDTPNYSEDDCVAYVQSDIERDSDIKDPETPEQWDVSATPKCTQIDSGNTEIT